MLPDGRLVLEVSGWDDDRLGQPSRHPTGLFASDDWSVFRVPPREDRGVPVLAVTVGDDRATFWATGWKGHSDEVRRTDDGGLTWEVARAR